MAAFDYCWFTGTVMHPVLHTGFAMLVMGMMFGVWWLGQKMHSTYHHGRAIPEPLMVFLAPISVMIFLYLAFMMPEKVGCVPMIWAQWVDAALTIIFVLAVTWCVERGKSLYVGVVVESWLIVQLGWNLYNETFNHEYQFLVLARLLYQPVTSTMSAILQPMYGYVQTRRARIVWYTGVVVLLVSGGLQMTQEWGSRALLTKG